LQTWGKFGVLILPASDGAIGGVVGQLPQQVRTKWHAALKSDHFRKRRVESLDLPAALQSFDKLVTLSGDVRVACLEETRALCFGLDEDALSMVTPDGNFEICRFEFADQSHFVRREAELWDRIILSGTHRNDIWKDRFRELGFNSRSIAVIDRYCLLRFEKLYFEGKSCGLTFFMKKLIEIPRKKGHALNIFTSDLDIDQKNALTHLRKTVSQISLPVAMSLHLHVIPDYVFSKVAHDRFLRFDSIVTSVGNGLRVFENEVCDKNFDCSLKWDADSEFRGKVEGMLRSASRSERIV
jgi:hypothetical protein